MMGRGWEARGGGRVPYRQVGELLVLGLYVVPHAACRPVAPRLGFRRSYNTQLS